ncbi:MAG: ABC transporter substrate-binding protein [Propionicimonas sp.]|uniref:ABC transporter substrate-binding protein n=1 Tax=Propionicimonas sp. TaxID=1955623 RepID=UPI003D112915
MTDSFTRRNFLGGTLALSALALVGCSTASADDGSGTRSSASPAGAGLQTVKIGIVPTLELGFLTIGEQQGYFSAEGLQLEVTPVDSGPNVITGLVAGQYDLGYTAYAPPLVALAGGQDLRLVEHLGDIGPKGTNGGILVAKDSPITSWKDLAGTKFGTNAPRSFGVLWVQAAIASEGGDPSTLELVPLPFNQIADNVASGKLDAGLALEPYLTQALKTQSNKVRNLGDAATAAFAEGTPSGGIFTSANTLTSKADLISRFRAGLEKSIAYGNEHLDDVRAAGATLSGLSSEDAATIRLDKIDTSVTAADFEPLLAAMKKFGWITTDIDINTFLGQ